MRIEPEHVKAVWYQLCEWGYLIDEDMRTLKDLIDEFDVALPDPQKNELGKFHRGDPDTARQAAIFNYPNSGNQRHRCLIAIAMAGDEGKTFDELVVDLSMYSAQKRLHDLKLGGWVEPSGSTRPTRTGAQAEAYVLTDKAARELRRRNA